MIQPTELRLGNLILFKNQGRISMVPCNYVHFDLMHKGDTSSLYPVVLKAEILQKSGCIANKDYPSLPQARAFVLVLPVIGNHRNELFGYVKTNGECFIRATVNGAVATNNFFHLHQLQNLFFALTGKELEIK